MLMIVRLLLVCFALIAASGCGQKGPLFLPGDPGEMQQVTPSADPEDETDEEREERIGGQR